MKIQKVDIWVKFLILYFYFVTSFQFSMVSTFNSSKCMTKTILYIITQNSTKILTNEFS